MKICLFYIAFSVVYGVMSYRGSRLLACREGKVTAVVRCREGNVTADSEEVMESS